MTRRARRAPITRRSPGRRSCQPVVRTMRPESAAPAEPSTSVAAWIMAPRRFRSSPVEARSMTRTGMPFATTPMSPTTRTPPPATSGGSPKRSVGLVEDAEADHDEQQAVHERGQDLGPSPAERPRATGRQARGPRRSERERDRAAVGDVVHGIGDQREAVEPDPGDDLDEAVGDRQSERDRERTCRARPVARMRVGMRVRVRVHDSKVSPRSAGGPANMIAR